MAYTTHVLVVASVTATSEDLLEALQHRAEKGPVELTLLMPATAIGPEGRRQAEHDLQQALALWRERGLTVEGQVGDRDPIDAVHEMWQPGRFDEVIVSTLPGATSRWLTVDAPHRIARITDLPVTHVVSRPPGWNQPPSGPPPQRERNPLAVFSWGGRRA
jgi:hypothetical protein